jgi:homoserine dehydrogenase
MRVALVGFGSVGKAVASLLAERREELYAREGLLTRLVAVVDSNGAAIGEHGLDAAELLAAKESRGTVGALARHGVDRSEYGTAAALIRDVQADVLVESSPSALSNPIPAFVHLRTAMSSGKHVVSVNKAPLAVAMPALLELARFNRVQMRYSGAVGAGTPVLSTARSLSRGDVITGVRAILNGTTNFILWKMLEQGAPYADVLREAQQLGYAETDPSTDVDGLDTATKVVILANSIFAGDGRSATVKDVVIEGIRGIASARVAEAAKRGKSIKLIGRIDLGMKGSASPTLSVRPEEVDRHGPMDVPRNLNAVQFTTRRAGDVTLVGAGAGGVQTATAIVRDIVDIWHSAEEERR